MVKESMMVEQYGAPETGWECRAEAVPASADQCKSPWRSVMIARFGTPGSES